MNSNKPSARKLGKPPLKLSLKLSSSTESIGHDQVPLSAPPSLKPNPPIKLKLSLKRSYDSLAAEQPAPTEAPKIRIRPAQPIPSPVIAPELTQEKPLPQKKARLVNFYDLLRKLVDLLKAKDVYGFFWEPVDVAQVPDYLEIVKEPMDFSTMEHKIAQKKYANISDFEADFLLIVGNAKTYNAPDSVYYKTADRLDTFGTKTIHKEAQKIADGDYELVYEPIAKDKTRPGQRAAQAMEKESSLSSATPRTHSLRLRDATRVSYAEDEIFEELELPTESEAEQELSRELQQRRSNIALFKRASDGSLQFTSLASFQPEFLTDGSLSLTPGQVRQLFVAEYATDRHPIPSLGQILPKPPPSGPKRDAADWEWQCAPLNYGPYVNSFAPTWDSSRSTLTPFESMLITLTYSDPQSRDFLQSLRQFADESELAYLVRYVEGLCNVLTKGTGAVHGIPLLDHLQNASIAATSLEHALTEQGKDIFPPIDDARESFLYQISKQLLQLVRIQNQRLASDDPATISTEEQARMDQIKQNLAQLCAQVQPGELISEQAVFDFYQAMQQPAVPQFPGTLSP